MFERPESRDVDITNCFNLDPFGYTSNSSQPWCWLERELQIVFAIDDGEQDLCLDKGSSNLSFGGLKRGHGGAAFLRILSRVK